jgi:hypothetical protein
VKDYLAALADFMETPRGATLKTPETPSRGSIEGFEGAPRRHFQKTRWPYATAAEEPRCPTCRHWWQTDAGCSVTHEAIGDCQLHHFETLERDNCKLHDPLQGSAHRRTQ